MKKALFSALLALLGVTSVHAQTTPPLYTGVFYKLTSNATAYRELKDTAIVAPNKPQFPPLTLRAKEEVLVMAYPTTRWAHVVKGGVWYYVLIKQLVPSEKPTADTSPAKIGAPVGASNYNPSSSTPSSAPSSSSRNTAEYQTIHTGPRGGQYYINSNGNKTYIKRK